MNAAIRQVPNALTALRLLAAPLLGILLNDGSFTLAFALFVFAGVSDALDGWLAKRLASPSRFGAWLDPAADKLLMLIAFVMLTHLGIVPVWLTALVIARDVAIVAGILLSLALALPISISPLAIGKACTVVQVAFVGLILFLRTLHLVFPIAESAAEIIVAAVTAVSWFAYGQLLLRALSPGRRTA